MTQETLKLALDALETELSIDWTNNDEFNASGEKMYEAIAVIKQALAQPERDYERGFIDGMQKQMQSSVDKAVNTMSQRTEQEPVVCNCNQGQVCHICDPITPSQRTEQEPVAWRTFDGEGGYDYRSYEDNESYADDWNKRNPKHVGWVDELYTHSQRTWLGLSLEWVEAPNHISYGKDMMEAIVPLGKDNSLHLYCPVEQIANVASALKALAQPEQEPVADALHFAQWTAAKKDLSDYICIGELTLAGIEDNLEGLEFGESEIERFEAVIESLQENLVTGRECKKVPLIAYIGENNITPPQRTEQEPMEKPAAVVSSCTGAGDKGVRVKWLGGFPQIGDCLYTHSPQRTWVGLTEEEIGDEYVRFEVAKGGFNRFEYAALAIEAKLKEKNCA